MAATSVTGIGPGSAEGANKGSEHVSMGVGRLIGPRVVAAGRATLVGGVVSIQVPVLTPATTDYIVIATATNSATATSVAVTAFTIETDTESTPSNNIYSPGAGNITTTSYDATLSFKGTGTVDVINWAIIKTGLA